MHKVDNNKGEIKGIHYVKRRKQNNTLSGR